MFYPLTLWKKILFHLSYPSPKKAMAIFPPWMHRTKILGEIHKNAPLLQSPKKFQIKLCAACEETNVAQTKGFPSKIQIKNCLCHPDIPKTQDYHQTYQNKPVLKTKKDKRSKALITKSMMSALFDPTGQLPRLSWATGSSCNHLTTCSSTLETAEFRNLETLQNLLWLPKIHRNTKLATWVGSIQSQFK